MTRPLIAITGRRVADGRITNWRTGALATPTPYAEALQRSGATPAVLLPQALDPDAASDTIAPFHGLLLTGGADVDPARYGQAAVPEVYGLDAETDAFELALLDAALRSGTPVLAICRGLQVLNVARGGTLDQHITDRPGLEAHGRPGVSGAAHTIHIDADTRLARAVGVASVVGTCHHHQAVDRVGDGLRVTARTDDGIVEGLELDDGWVVAVQWHPEDTAAVDPDQQHLFDGFVAETAVVGRRA
jgi:putative glutamine amidotransferase